MELTIGTTELNIKPLGAVQVMDLLLKGAKARYINDAKELAATLEGREKAAYMAEVLRGLKSFGMEDAQEYSQSVDAMAKMLAKAAGISEAKASEVLQEADGDDVRVIMETISPSGEEDEKVLRFQNAVDAVLSARLDGDTEAMAGAVEECSNALRSVSLIEDTVGNA